MKPKNGKSLLRSQNSFKGEACQRKQEEQTLTGQDATMQLSIICKTTTTQNCSGLTDKRSLLILNHTELKQTHN